MKTNCLARMSALLSGLCLIAAAQAAGPDSQLFLFSAAASGDTDSIPALLAQGADINGRNGYGNTALIVAAQQGRSETVLALLANGADINATGSLDRTAMHWAVLGGHVDAVTALRSAGADRNQADSTGFSPVDYARSSNDQALRQALGLAAS